MKKKNIQLPSEYLNSRPELIETWDSIKKLIFNITPIGAALHEILFELPSKIQQKRINDTVELISKNLKNIEENSIDKKYLKSEDFYDFTRKLFQESLKVQSKEKRTLLSNIYTSAIIKNESFDNGRSQFFMRIVSDIFIEEILILKYIEENEYKLKKISNYINFYDHFKQKNSNWYKGEYDFKYFCLNLENKSLISTGSGLKDFRSKSSFIALENHEEPSVTVTPLGKKFIDYISFK
ncbi:hypothetical protein [Neptunitalea lumnitzerae]|uniref:Uncharacterized protein n=1 Tax=Neptunitalea lumnitzerae TaxID=2965509 RepID=A0ABQ5MEV0_9FLAO|nr:hypothetical protein [Neptunitalea sp. Y10]GLB47898.1 hypothetical protein Y10_02660 [Neptunitalea sp. Y10]